MDVYQTFLITLKTGEKALGLSYADYQDAYTFSQQHFSAMSHHLLDYFKMHSPLTPERYERDLIRYSFIKAIEHRISSDLFTNTSRGNVCDLFLSPFDISLKNYPTNLPLFLERMVNERQMEAARLTSSIIETLDENGACVEEPVLNAVMFLGQTVGHRVGNENKAYLSYNTSEMLTRNELNSIAGVNLCKWIERDGFNVIQTNFNRETPWSVVAECEGEKYYIFMSTEIAPVAPGFRREDLDLLYKAARNDGAIPWYASVSLASNDDQRFQDGVVLAGESVRFMVNAFDELVAEE